MIEAQSREGLGVDLAALSELISHQMELSNDDGDDDGDDHDDDDDDDHDDDDHDDDNGDDDGDDDDNDDDDGVQLSIAKVSGWNKEDSWPTPQPTKVTKTPCPTEKSHSKPTPKPKKPFPKKTTIVEWMAFGKKD